MNSLSKKLTLLFTCVFTVTIIAIFISSAWHFKSNMLLYSEQSLHNSMHNIRKTLVEKKLHALTQEQLNGFISEWLSQKIYASPPSLDSSLLHSKWAIVTTDYNLPRHSTKMPIEWFDYLGNKVKPPAIKTKPYLSLPFLMNDNNGGVHAGFIKGVIDRNYQTTLVKNIIAHKIVYLLLFNAFLLILSLLTFFIFTKTQLSPLKSLVRGFGDFNSGRYHTRISYEKNDELKTLADNFNQLGTILDTKQKSQRRWLANISHELRTPITTLNCEIESLEDGLIPFNKQQLSSFSQEVKRLQYLVDDLYELSLSETGGYKYNFTSLDISECIKKTITSFELQAKKSDIKILFTSEQELICRADSKRIFQLLTNLVNNSIAYTSSPGAITITAKKRKEHIKIIIEDTAPAPTKDTEKLFDPFFRGTNENNMKKGAGLGLTICRNIVKSHGGKIYAKPSKFGGLCITIELPIS